MVQSRTVPLTMQPWEGCLFVVLATLASGFNLAPKYATVISDPSNQTNSYFGFSLHLMAQATPTGTDAFMIVGAPRAQSPSHEDLVDPGVVYQCDISQGGDCFQITLDTTGNNYSTTNQHQSFRHRKDNAWIGAAMDVHESTGRLVVCGPRWINQFYNDFYLMNGICYLKFYPFISDNPANTLLPLISKDYQGYTVMKESTGEKVEVLYYAYGEAGSSVHFTEDGDETLIGAPGVKEWAGTVVQYKNVLSHPRVVPNPVNTQELTDFGYFGYSLGSGKFLRPKGSIHYVSGAPRAANLKGIVLVFNFPLANDAPYDILTEREGYQLGEYFGASVCVVDLNGDGLDDLVVGAPQHSLTMDGTTRVTGDEGRVYIFINEDMGILRDIGGDIKIMGSQIQGSRFGTTIAKIGDINMDGYQDIAVGAPYENGGRGAIYIYHGRSSGIHHRYSQRVTAEEIDPSLRGFGMGISRGVDVDGNSYKDLAVGAFSSRHAVVIPSSPVIAFRSRIYSHVDKIRPDATGFTSSACIFFSGKHAPPHVDVKINLIVVSVDGRAQFAMSEETGRTSNTHSYTLTIGNNEEKCKDIQIKLRKEASQDLSKPIELQMQYKLDTRETEDNMETTVKPEVFCKTCAVVDPNHNSLVIYKVPYAIACGEDGVCRPDLRIAVNFIDIKSTFVIGTMTRLGIRVVVSNVDQPAFLVKLNVSVSSLTPLYRLPPICQEVTLEDDDEMRTQLECDLGNIEATGGKKEFVLEVDVSMLEARTQLLDYRFNVSSAGAERVPTDNTQTISLPVQTMADVYIIGKSSQIKGVYGSENHTFFHTFDVANNGPSPVNILGLRFQIPLAMKTSSGLVNFVRIYKPTAYFDSQTFPCSPLKGSFASDVDRSRVSLKEGDAIGQSTTKRSVDYSASQSVATTAQSEPHVDVRDLPTNRTLFVNCTNPDTKCLTVQCDAGPFKTKHNRAVITFRLTADFQKLEPILGKMDIVVISSIGSVVIENLPNAVQPPSGKSDIATVVSIFYGSLTEESVATWVLAVAIAGGILILLLIIGALIKLGFFRRKEKDDLQTLKDDSMIKDFDFGNMNTANT